MATPTCKGAWARPFSLRVLLPNNPGSTGRTRGRVGADEASVMPAFSPPSHSSHGPEEWVELVFLYVTGVLLLF